MPNFELRRNLIHALALAQPSQDSTACRTIASLWRYLAAQRLTREVGGLLAMEAGACNTPAMTRDMIWSSLVFAALVLAGFVVVRVVLKVIPSWTRRTGTVVDDALSRHVSAPLQWTVPLLVGRMSLPLLGLPKEIHDAVEHVVLVILIFCAGWIALQGIRAAEDIIVRWFDTNIDDNLHARSVQTQFRAFRNIAAFVVVLLVLAFALMTFEAVREIGAGLLASAGVAGIVVGFAAQRSIATVVAGIQIAFAQPVRIDDVVIVDGYWGRVEEITLTYVVIRVWDQRRLVVPVTRFLEQPFENWTRKSADLLGTVELDLDFRAPIDPLRDELRRIVEAAPQWDGKVAVVQVVDIRNRSLLVRALVSAAESGPLWELRCLVRERLVTFVNEHYPWALPLHRARIQQDENDDPAMNFVERTG